MGKITTLFLVGRGHWGGVYKKTIGTMKNIVLPINNIHGKDYKKGLKQLSRDSIDGVIVASATSSHYEVVSYLLKHGFRNLLIEKPLTSTLAQANKLQKLLEDIPDAVILVGHVLIYDPAYSTMKKIAYRKLGKITQINYTSLKTPPIRGSTVIRDAGSPPIYLFMDFVGEKPVKVSARALLNDNIELILEFNNGMRGIANIGSIYPQRKREIAIAGERGKLVLTEFMDPRQLLFLDNNNNKELLSFSEDTVPLEEEILEFIASIKTGKHPRTSLSQGVEVIDVIEAAEKSLKENGEFIQLS